mgnify:CR=1 FL=1
MRRNLTAILIGLAMFSDNTSRKDRIVSVPKSNKIKQKKILKPKNKPNHKYGSSKPIKSKATNIFRNKSNI